MGAALVRSCEDIARECAALDVERTSRNPSAFGAFGFQSFERERLSSSSPKELLFLHVERSNAEAIAFYRRLGYKEQLKQRDEICDKPVLFALEEQRGLVDERG